MKKINNTFIKGKRRFSFGKAKGITLIALIVTIIVLLILVAVTLNIVLGENGILKKAKNTKIETEKTQYGEELQLFFINAKAEYMSINNKVPTLKELCEYARENKTDKIDNIEIIYKEETANITITDGGIEEPDYVQITYKNYIFNMDKDINFIDTREQVSENPEPIPAPDPIPSQDTTSPIVSITGGTLGKIIAEASDNESGILGYVISTQETIPEDTAYTEWNGESKEINVTNNVKTYLCVKNNEGLISTKSFSVHQHEGESLATESNGCYTVVESDYGDKWTTKKLYYYTFYGTPTLGNINKNTFNGYATDKEFYAEMSLSGTKYFFAKAPSITLV